jgi:hypothetical protein
MAERSFSNDDMRLYELLQQFLCLSTDTERAGTLLLLGPTGSIIGDCTLSAGDIEAATDVLRNLNVSRGDAIDPPADPLPIDDQDDLCDEDIDDLVGAFEQLLKSEGGQA